MNHRFRFRLTYLAAACALLACDATPSAHAEGNADAAPRSRAEPPSQPRRAAAPVDPKRYPGLDGGEHAELESLEARFAPPEGYERVSIEPDSFGQFLRTLPLRADRTTVRSYAGKRLGSPSAAVVALDVGERNLQQCADSVIRLHAEYLWSRGARDELAYHFTSGDETAWSDWRAGERYRVSGSTVERVRRGSVEPTHANFRRWLDTVFMYAGTRSLRFDSEPVTGELQPGDFLVAPGSPGHAVLVLDIAENADGDRLALIGQGFMPAQEFHVVRDDHAGVVDGVWFVLPPNPYGSIKTPSWRAFSKKQARRFR